MTATSTTVPTLADVIGALETAYPPALAESWDSVGLVAGDPADEVRKVVVAVDATAAVVDEALASGAQLLLVHHPLLLRGVDTVGAHTPKGALLHRLIRGGCALYSAHTNADRADPGVSDALAGALGLVATRPLVPIPDTATDKWVVMVPTTDTVRIREALFAAGAGELGDYRECSWTVTGDGQFRPLPGAAPTLGVVGEVEAVREDRVEVIAPRRSRARILAALRAAHPYEEPAFDVFETADFPGSRGLGRIGELPEPQTLREFTARVAAALPRTEWGVRAAGDPDRVVRTVAVCGGSGDSLLDTVSGLGADVYVTADLRHHPADEHLRRGGPALVDVAHWASEQPWCAQAKGVLDGRFGSVDGWDVRVTELRTDPWTVACH
ncbi:Nif3-like dinuclear metal center hexameric protein [Prescottella equi]|uniref:Nif3-like dinuclear metal center hexameric protein n=1 Tax=Rhodococcus hoagii TaxID=43767 RepID=UPI000A101C6F|nr:Nif3-like dinuclear metal center hexameric protein [Prescottella equi]MBM4471784.1 Nif3-like dinuclear metal center hexameric protein [Prescottella equi]MBM4518718.1 Nif3-like dinuclear metal center hexameric protein [Prescottella equi]MBM4530492.1 Nif3-like dinuclear metal center hexameric protein [Prescottella equi]MBM4544298.1 Nif3-like dinuclear metal center hexameric protein [Prescottella equi]MBM4570803.1 Nif3-like dinuclear metal center hexameric protein [Prescottella equi]